MKIKELKELLKPLDDNTKILLGSDEELNTLYETIQVGIDKDTGMYLIWGERIYK